MCLSNFGGRTANIIDFRNWPPISFKLAIRYCQKPVQSSVQSKKTQKSQSFPATRLCFAVPGMSAPYRSLLLLTCKATGKSAGLRYFDLYNRKVPRRRAKKIRVVLREPLAQLIQVHLERNRSLPVIVATAAFQPRSKVGIWNFAVIDMSFGQCHRGKANLLRQNLTAGIGAVADAA